MTAFEKYALERALHNAHREPNTLEQVYKRPGERKLKEWHRLLEYAADLRGFSATSWVTIDKANNVAFSAIVYCQRYDGKLWAYYVGQGKSCTLDLTNYKVTVKEAQL